VITLFNKHDDLFKFSGWDEQMPFGRGFPPGFGFPPGHGIGPGGFGPQRFFERGDLKYVILNLIKEQPRHGYDIIQELEKKFHGFYNPSAGTVYPILQLFEDQDLVTIDQKNGKKVYAITPEGEKYLEEHKEDLERMEARSKHFGQFGPQMHELREDMFRTMHPVFRLAASGAFNDPETMKELRTALTKFRNDVEVIVSKRKDKENKKEEK
jgi:DNA-binding PadR family transcriptional regulator